MKVSIRFTKRSEKHSDGTVAIRMRVSWNSTRFDMVLPQRVPEKYWDVKKECCKSSWTESAPYNKYISFLTSKVENMFIESESAGIIPSLEDVKACFKSTEENKLTILALMELWIEHGSKVNNLSRSTINNRENLKKKLIEWDPLVAVKQFDKQKLVNFIVFCSENLRSSTASRMQLEVRMFLRWCIENDYIEDRKLLDVSVKFKHATNEPLFLTIDELKAFENVDTDSKTQENIKYAFIFACYSGLRFSDLKKLKKSDIHDGCIHIVTQKTSSRITIELNKKTEEIVERFKDTPSENLFKIHTKNTYNTNLRKLAERARIDTPVTKVYYIGAERIEETRPKYEIMTSHVARRTFVTVALTLGIPAEVVMKWTGHKDFENMRPYISIVDKLKKHNMQKFDTL